VSEQPDIDRIARLVWERQRDVHLDRGVILSRWEDEAEELREDWRNIVRWVHDASVPSAAFIPANLAYLLEERRNLKPGEWQVVPRGSLG
jgi:hypothetical protein